MRGERAMANKKNLSAGANALIAVIIMAGMWCSAAAWAADWRPYAGDQFFSWSYDALWIDYPYKTVYNALNLEFSKLRIAGVWTKRTIRDNKGREWQVQEQKKLGLTTNGYERYEYTVARKELNCSEKKYRVLSETDYNDAGEVLSSFINEAGNVEWKPIPPDSNTEALYHVICEKARKRKDDQREPK